MVKCVSARQAWETLKADPGSVLIDVRTAAEFEAVGLPDLSSLGRETCVLTWDPYAIESFAQDLRRAVPDLATPLFFLCRSGMRSQQTAELAEHLGYETSVNIVEGYEGPPDASGQRGHVRGWQFEGLPVRFP